MALDRLKLEAGDNVAIEPDLVLQKLKIKLTGVAKAAELAAGGGASKVGLDQTLTPDAGTVAALLFGLVNPLAAPFSAPTDGVTDATTAIANAVAHAQATGKVMFWPNLTFETTASIPGLHAVQHMGNGIIKRGSDLWRVSPTTQTNTLYVSSAGNDANDGLSAAQPKLTVQSAIDALSSGWRAQLAVGGVWKMQLTAGTFARGRFPDEGMRSRNPIQVVGAPVGGHPNVPTTLIKEGATQAAVGLRAGICTDLYVQDIRFEDFNGSTSSSGITVFNRCNLLTVNCHFEDCYIGVSGSEWCELDMKGGLLNDCGYLNSVTAGGYCVRGLFHCKFSIGLQNAGARTQGPLFTNSHFGVFGQEYCTGHVDWSSFTNCTEGVRMSVNSRVNTDGCLFDTCGAAGRGTDGGVISASSSTTFTNCNQNIVTGGGGGSSSSPVIAEWSASYGQTEYVAWGLKAQQVINSTSATIIQQATIKAGMLRETYGSLVPPKAIGFRMRGTLNGTNDTKRIQLRLGSTVANITFTAAETGAFTAEGEVTFRSPGQQLASVEGYRFGGTGGRVGIVTMTEALTADAAFNIEALVGNGADNITLETCVLFFKGV